jgi:UDP-N-acetylglucosamine 4,6-dehydratase
LKMPAVRIGTLAEAMIEELSQGHGYKPADIQIKNIGIKAGEKMHEDLMTEEELTRSIETDEFIIILPQIKELYDNMRPKYCKIPNARTTSFSSKDARILSKQEIKELLKDAL